MASDPYVSVHLMEFVWKQQSCEKESALADGNPATEEENMDEEIEEDQGENANLITVTATTTLINNFVKYNKNIVFFGFSTAVE